MLEEELGLCKACAPDVKVEIAAAQAAKTVEEIHARARVAAKDLPSKIDWRSDRKKAACPGCGALLPGDVRFCPECGQKVQLKENQFNFLKTNKNHHRRRCLAV